MSKLLVPLKPKFVGYYTSESKGVVSTVIVANVKDNPALFTLTLFRRERPKQGHKILEGYRIQPGSTHTFWPPAFTVRAGDRLQAKSSKKGALVVTIGGIQC